MADKVPFEPHTPETMLTVKISLREAKVIQILRKSAFGKFTVQKMNNVIVRIERDESIMIDEDKSLLETFAVKG